MPLAAVVNISRATAASPPDAASKAADGDERETLGRFGRIDALVNNAGHARVVPVDRSTPEVFDEAIARNAAPVAYATHAVWPRSTQATDCERSIAT